MNKAGHIVTACIVASLFATAFGGLGVVIILSPLAFLALFIYKGRILGEQVNFGNNLSCVLGGNAVQKIRHAFG